MGQVFNLPSQSTGAIADTDPHTLDFYLPQMANAVRPVSEGRLTLVVTPTLAVGTDVTTNLTLSVSPIISTEDAVAVVQPTAHASSDYTAALTLFNAQTWVSGASYEFDVSFLAGLALYFGVRLSATYTVGAAGKQITVVAYLICE